MDQQKELLIVLNMTRDGVKAGYWDTVVSNLQYALQLAEELHNINLNLIPDNKKKDNRY